MPYGITGIPAKIEIHYQLIKKAGTPLDI